MKAGERFSVETVKGIKRMMLRGARDIPIARLMKCSANTIRRIRSGETYGWIVVEGEEMLRPKIEGVEYDPFEPEVEERSMRVAVAMPTDEEIEETERMLLEHQAKVRTLPKKEEVLTPKETLEKYFPGAG